MPDPAPRSVILGAHPDNVDTDTLRYIDLPEGTTRVYLAASGEGPELLTPREHNLIERLGDWWGDFCGVVADGPTRDADLAEAIHHVHTLQHKLMAQAAARAYPHHYRTLGSTIPPTGDTTP